MLRKLTLLLSCALITASLTVPVVAQESAHRKAKALVITGGHEVDEPSFHAMLDSIGTMTWKEVKHPNAHSCLVPEKSNEYDFILLYDAWENISEEEKANFIRTVQEGKPVLALHHSLLSYSHWSDFAALIGGRYIYRGEQVIDGKRYGYSAVKDDAEIVCNVVDSGHPILQGVASAFTVTDELYAKMYIAPTVNVLLETRLAGMETPIAWTNHYGKGKIFTLQLGHGKKSFEDANFKKMMTQAVTWLTRPEQLRKNPPVEMRKKGWGNPNFVTYRNLDDEPAEECVAQFFRDQSHHAYYDVTTSYWAVLDGKTNAVRFVSDDKTSISRFVNCVFKDGRWQLKMESFKEGKYEFDDADRIRGITLQEFAGFDSVTKKITILSSEENSSSFPETIPGLPQGTNTKPIPKLEDREPLKTLIVTGINGAHWWQGSTEVLKRMMENTGLFVCDIAVMNGQPESVRPEDVDFGTYRLVVFNHVPNDWSAKAKENFKKYVENGGGLVLLHGATLAFPSWKEYNEMMGLGAWMNRNEKDGPYVYWQEGRFVRDESPGWAGYHGRQHPFVVVHRAPRHPILKGLPTEWLHFKDELYGKMRGPAKNMEVLATAYDAPEANDGLGGSDRHEPMLWTVNYGKGRVFVDAMGHAGDDLPRVYALECTGFQVTFLRGCEWAATGEVTQPVPDDMPTKYEHSFRRDFRP